MTAQIICSKRAACRKLKVKVIQQGDFEDMV